eukprot:TRINITY_DN2073_c0_g1_i2.p2 TRINITY_DN2073_c0_g1~~TRINITY_DN2073_c0_g1_i2.p2  ORF type:complete len:184 (+),score=34.91 TRINITY_DN2073_c0_g1_i2:536-1087(+)
MTTQKDIGNINSVLLQAPLILLNTILFQNHYNVLTITLKETFVQIPKKPHPLSFIFSEDVASLVIRVIEAGSITFGEAFNFGCFETPTMEEYLNEISRRLGITPRYQKKNDPKSFLPSVSFGPIDIGKAVSVLKMKPTPFSEVLRRTVEWHEDAWAKYPDLRPTCKLNLSEQAIVALGQHYQR